MAKVTLTTGQDGQTLHGRTTATTVESQVVVIGTDGTDAVLDPATLATQATAAAILAELAQKLETGGQVALDSATLAALETIQVGNDPATNTTLAAVLAAVQGPDTVYRGTSGATIDLASGERLHSVLVVPTASGQVTVTVPGAAPDQAPVDFPYSEDFKGGVGGPTDVVIAGAVAYYRVTTYTP